MATIATKRPTTGGVSTTQYDPNDRKYALQGQLSNWATWGAMSPEARNREQIQKAEIERRNDGANAERENLMTPIPAPKRDPRITALMDSQRELAKRFRANMPGYMDDEFQTYSRDRGRELQGEREDIDASYNRRGLLRSGMQAGSSGDAGARATKDLYEKRLEIGDRYRKTADALDDEALNTEIALAGGQAQVGAASAEAQAKMQDLILESRINRQNALEGAFQTGGALFGSWLGKQSSGSGYTPGENGFLDYYMGAD